MKPMKPMKSSFDRPSCPEGRLERAIAAVVEAASHEKPRLSDAARARILESAYRGEASEAQLSPFAPLFAGHRRLVITGALPLLLAVGLILLLEAPLGSPVLDRTSGIAGSHVSRVTVTKDADEIHFHIANGGRPHRVLRSQSPRDFDPGSAVTVQDGAYSDAIEGSGDLVFYRIE